MRIALTGGIACGKSLVAKFFRELGVQTLDADDVVHELEAPGGAAVSAIVSRFGQSVLAPDGGIDRSKLAEIVFSGGSRSCATGTFPTGGAQLVATAARRDLEAILHPLVRKRLLDFASTAPSLDFRHSTLDNRHPARPSDSRLPSLNSQPLNSQPLNSQPLNSQPLNSQPLNSQLLTLNFKLSIIPLLFESHFEPDYDTILCVSSTEDRQIDRMMRTRGYTREQAEARLAAQMPVAEKAARADWTIQNNSTVEELKAEVQRCVAWLTGRMEKAE